MKNLKTISVLSVLMFSLLIGVNNSSAATLATTLKGRILLQVEQNGEAWYVNPVNELRYYLGRPVDAFNVMRELGLGISNKDFDSFNGYAPSRLSGRILLKVADSGKAYYVNTNDLKMYYLGRPADAFNVMRELGLGITDKNLGLISVASTSNLTRLEEFGIEIEFFEGYDTTSAGGRTVILFGPLGGNLGPVPTNEKSHIYELTAIEKRTANEIIAQVNKDGGGLITVKPEIININNITVVKWAEGGLCENRSMEVVGTKKNYLLSSLGCHKDQKFDFDYFEKTIETIKFTDSVNATGIIKSVYSKSGKNYIDIDYVEFNPNWIPGGSTGWAYQNNPLRTFEISPSAKFVVGSPATDSITFSDFQKYFTTSDTSVYQKDNPWDIVIVNGVVTKITEHFVP